MKKLLSALALVATLGLAHAGGGHGGAGGDLVAEDVNRQLNRVIEKTDSMDISEIVYVLQGTLPKQIASYINRIKIRTTDQSVKTPKGRDVVLILDENGHLSVQREAYKALDDQKRFSMVYSMVLSGVQGRLNLIDESLEARETIHRIFSEQPQK